MQITCQYPNQITNMAGNKPSAQLHDIPYLIDLLQSLGEPRDNQGEAVVRYLDETLLVLLDVETRVGRLRARPVRKLRRDVKVMIQVGYINAITHQKGHQLQKSN